VEVEDHGGLQWLPWYGRADGILREIGSFLHDLIEEQARFDRVLATVIFTDIVGSTSRAAELGDRKWRELLERHRAVVRGMLARYRGSEVDTACDGFFATFDGPARAIWCAQSDRGRRAGARARGPGRLAHRGGRDDRRDGELGVPERARLW
jgi:class 3 adenylate cyclase